MKSISILGSTGSIGVSTLSVVDSLSDKFVVAGLAAGRDRVLDAMRDVIAQHLLLDPAQRGADRGDLRDDVDAAAVVFHHAGEAADLAFDSTEALCAGRLDVGSHAGYIPLRGRGCK